MPPHIDYPLRKQRHTEKAIAYALTINATPLLVTIHYPQHPVYQTIHPPAYYLIDRGNARPLSREAASKVAPVLRIAYLADGEAIWTE